MYEMSFRWVSNDVNFDWLFKNEFIVKRSKVVSWVQINFDLIYDLSVFFEL